MRPAEGKPAWIQYDFKVSDRNFISARPTSSTTTRFCRLPASWRLLYKDGSAWKPVENNEPYTVEKDKFNQVTFKPVKTTAVRIEVEPQSILYKDGAAGPPAAMPIDEDVNGGKPASSNGG